MPARTGVEFLRSLKDCREIWLGGEPIENPIPPLTTRLPRFPLHSLLRVVQPVVYRWYKLRDEAG